MTKDEVIDKVRKLFRLAKSSNENEAALAATKARELLSKHNLAMSDLSVDEIRSTVEVAEAFVDAGKVLRNWIKGLIVHVSRAFECQHLVRRRPGASPILSFIGTRADCEVAAYTFRFLMEELKRLANRALPDLKRTHRGWSSQSLKNAYLTGAVVRIGERFEEKVEEVRAEELRVCTALVVAKEQMISQYMEQTFGRIRREYGRSTTVSARAYQRGYAEAGAIELNHGTEEPELRQAALAR